MPEEVRDLLRSQNHDAMTVRDQELVGSADVDLLAICRNENRILITLDLDFADVRFVSGESHPGIVVLRAARLGKSDILSIVTKVVPSFETEAVSDSLWIVDETRVRIRSTRE
ncbi:MAG: DUF5615 family PIN-like protein [Phycisphaerales bacterium]|nr:DUF5615 family PIN-like protein [Phycisphaerales bacterium]